MIVVQSERIRYDTNVINTMRKGEFAMRAQNLTLLTDLYELTMMQGYYENPSDQIVVFDAFYRKNPCGGAYAVCAGLEQVIEYVRDLHFSPDDIDYLRSLHIFNDDFLEYLRGFHFTGDIYAIPEGTVVFPREPLLKVVAPIMEAQLVETAILNMINHQSLIATKASRVVYAAKGDGIMEFGLRRAQGPDAGIYGARAAMIGGCIGVFIAWKIITSLPMHILIYLVCVVLLWTSYSILSARAKDLKAKKA